MYIKQLILQGFKTYKDLTVVDEFDPALNVILGKNGAGVYE
jgi:structural maintenance of chromosome 3 (chondroitin sulfate proteoglycan 6)